MQSRSHQSSRILFRLRWNNTFLYSPRTAKCLQYVSAFQKQNIFSCKFRPNSAIDGGILSAIAQDPSSDLQQLMRPLDAWRMSLPAQLQIANGSPNGDIYYIELQGTSYRYEATICRLLQRHLRGVDAARSDWAKQRLRSAMFELDAITGRMLANGMLAKVPISL